MIDEKDFVDPKEHPKTYAFQVILGLIYFACVFYGIYLVVEIFWPILGL